MVSDERLRQLEEETRVRVAEYKARHDRAAKARGYTELVGSDKEVYDMQHGIAVAYCEGRGVLPSMRDEFAEAYATEFDASMPLIHALRVGEAFERWRAVR